MIIKLAMGLEEQFSHQNMDHAGQMSAMQNTSMKMMKNSNTLMSKFTRPKTFKPAAPLAQWD